MKERTEEKMSKAEDVFEDENRELVERYKSKFRGGFMYLMPNGGPVYEKEKTGRCYYIDDNVMEYIEEGLRTGKDVVLKKYKNNEFIEDPNVLY